MQTRKFLTFFAGFILVCVLLALVLFFVRDRLPGYLNQNTPAAVVNDYLTAILREDTQRAYGYLGDWNNKPDLESFTQVLTGKTGYQYCLDINHYSDPAAENLTETAIYIETFRCGPEWQVNWDVYNNSGKPEISPNEAKVRLIDGEWKIEQMPLPWWNKTWLP